MFRCADGRDGIARRLLGGLDPWQRGFVLRLGRVEFSLRFLGDLLEPVGVVLRVIGPVLAASKRLRSFWLRWGDAAGSFACGNHGVLRVHL